MADTTLTLGLVTFQGFEIPAKIPFGGEQALSIKKMVGGARVVDPLGQDDADIAWSGRFQSGDAMDRALAVDEMRKGGQDQVLTVAGLSYTVKVQKFTFIVERLYQVLYEINLTVVQDNTQAPQPSSATLDDVVGADTDSLDAIAPDISDPTAGSALSSLNSAIGSVGTLEGATLAALAPVAAAAASANEIIENVANATDPTIQSDVGTIAGVTAGGSAPAMIAIFQVQQAAIGQMVSLKQAAALTGRIETNVAQATG